MPPFGIDLGLGALSALDTPADPRKPARPPPLPTSFFPEKMLAQETFKAPKVTNTPASQPQARPTPAPAAAKPQAQKPRNSSQQPTSGERAASRNRSTDSDSEEVGNSDQLIAYVPVMERDPHDEKHQHEGEDHYSEDHGGNEASAAAVQSGDIDYDSLSDQLAGEAVAENIFEVLLPNGKRMGVVITLSDKVAQFLLSPSDPELTDQLKQRKKELKRRLMQRMNKDVEIDVF